MKKEKLLFNRLLLRYKKYVLKLERLLVLNKNIHRQGVLKKHIARLYKKLSSLDSSIKQYSRAAVFGLALVGGGFTATGQTSFDSPVAYPFNFNGNQYFSIMNFADLDNDGDLDAILGDKEGNNPTRFIENTGDGATIFFENEIDLPHNIGTPAIRDMDGDGDLDLLGHVEIDGEIKFVYSENTGTLENFNFDSLEADPFNLGVSNAAIIDAIGNYGTKVIVEDFDNDGDYDILFNVLDEFVYYIENLGNSQTPFFETIEQSPFGITQVFNSEFTAGDIDNDGDIDLISLRPTFGGSQSWSYYENQGTPELPLFNLPQSGNALNLPSAFAQSGPSLVDIDLDGDLDIFYSTYDYESDVTIIAPFFLENKCIDDQDGSINFDGPFTNIYNMNFNIHSDYRSLVTSSFVDIDDDGDFDIFFCQAPDDYDETFIVWKENTGTPESPVFSSTMNPDSLGINQVDDEYVLGLNFSDFDNDGDYDAIGSIRDDGFYYYENIGTASMPQFDDPVINPFGLSGIDSVVLIPTLADINNDGLIDIGTGTQNDDGNFYFFYK